MTVKEMYIRVASDLSSLASQRNRRYSPEQIEQELNVEVDEFVRRAAPENPEGFFSVAGQYLDAIRPLIVTKDLSVNIRSPFEVEAYLPLDEHKVLSLAAGISRASSECSVVKPYSNLRIYRIPLPEQAVGSSVELKIGEEIIYTRNKGKHANRDVFNLISELEGNLDNVQGYYGDLMVQYESKVELPVTLMLDGEVYQGELIELKVLSKIASTPTHSILNVRRVQNQMMPEVQSTAYYQATFKELTCILNHLNLVVNTPNNLIVNSLQLVYIRRPRKLSLALGIDCDLHPSAHNEICDRTVQRIRERIGDPKFQSGMTQNSNTL